MADTKEYKDLFKQSGVPKRLLVSFPDLSVTLQNEDIVSESMEISESLCSGSELRFGSCEASVFKLRIIGNVIPLIGATCVVSMYAGDAVDPFVLGTYKVASDKPTADRKYRDIVAYDAMYDIINADVAAWYNSILPTKDSTTTLRAFRDSFMEQFGMEQEEITLPHDEMVVERTIDPEAISGKDVLSAICEINGCFGHIGRNGKMQYIFLREIVTGLYPSDELYPSDDLFPRDNSGTEKIPQQNYISCKYEDYTTKRIGKLQIRQEENDIGCIIGNGENGYIIEGNFLVFGKDAAGLEAIGQRLFDIIGIVWYRPATVKAIGNPYLEVGAGIRMITQHEIVETYILERTLKGIQGLIDDYEAQGAETYSDNVNSVQKSIVQLKGKMNILTRTAEETRSQLIDLDKELSSQILQTAEEISAEVKRAKEAEASLSIRADEISLSVSNLDSNLSSRITQTAESITSEVSRAQSAESSLSSRITQNADSITAEVSRAQSAESSLSLRVDGISLSVTNLEESVQSDIEVLAGEINLRTTQGQVSSMISVALEDITISASQINLEGYTTINGGFSVDSSGSVTISSSSAKISMYGNTLQIASKSGGGVARIGNSFITFYDSGYVDTYAVAYLSGTTLIIGDGSCTVDCGSVSCSGDIECSTLNGYVPVTRAEFTSLRERVAKLETKVG